MDVAAQFPFDRIPESFRTDVARRPADPGGGVDGAHWLRRLPHIVSERVREWELTPDGDVHVGTSAVVFDVRAQGRKAALKISWPHAEAQQEHLALRAWDGDAAVRMFAAHPRDAALLLERCETAHQLHSMTALDAAEAVGELAHDLIHPPLPQLSSASQWCERIRTRLGTRGFPLPRRLLEQGRALASDLATDARVDAELVHTDLHDRNVMLAPRRGRGPRLVAIDPKPMNGERALMIAPLIWNRTDEARRAHNLRNHLRFRVDYAAEPAGVDVERARAWTIIRVLDNAWWDWQTRPDADLTQHVTIVKAMQG